MDLLSAALSESGLDLSNDFGANENSCTSNNGTDSSFSSSSSTVPSTNITLPPTCLNGGRPLLSTPVNLTTPYPHTIQVSCAPCGDVYTRTMHPSFIARSQTSHQLLSGPNHSFGIRQNVGTRPAFVLPVTQSSHERSQTFKIVRMPPSLLASSCNVMSVVTDGIMPTVSRHTTVSENTICTASKSQSQALISESVVLSSCNDGCSRIIVCNNSTNNNYVRILQSSASTLSHIPPGSSNSLCVMKQTGPTADLHSLAGSFNSDQTISITREVKKLKNGVTVVGNADRFFVDKNGLLVKVALPAASSSLAARCVYTDANKILTVCESVNQALDGTATAKKSKIISVVSSLQRPHHVNVMVVDPNIPLSSAKIVPFTANKTLPSTSAHLSYNSGYSISVVSSNGHDRPIGNNKNSYLVAMKESPTSAEMLNDIKHNGWQRTVHCAKQVQLQSEQHLPEDMDDDSGDVGHAETYNEYMPRKLTIGVKHPDAVVETSSMASVEPPEVYYHLTLSESLIDSGVLSGLQLESITYACQQHESVMPGGIRAGYLIGDGAGVGKGRTVAGIIYENWLLGRKRAIWFSVSNDLRLDAQRDLADIGADIKVYCLSKFKYAKLQSKVNGNVKRGVVFATYSSLIGESQYKGQKYCTRFKQLIKWCGKQYDGVIVFDECHKAKNLCTNGTCKSTKTGQTVLELQRRLPLARVVYASATGASEPKNMAYMVRLGLWGPGTPFARFADFLAAVEKRGVGAMELVAMDMKVRGMYIARQLSFKGVTFRIAEIPLDPKYKEMYNHSVNVWIEAYAMFQKALSIVKTDNKRIWGQFWSAHQRFFKYLCISAKVDYCVSLAKEALKAGKCVVIGLQSTGEARMLEMVEEYGCELSDFISTAKGVLQTLVEKHFPLPSAHDTWSMMMKGCGVESPVSGSNRHQVNGIAISGRTSGRNDCIGDGICDNDDDGHDDDDDVAAGGMSNDSLSSSDFESSQSDSEEDSNPFRNDSDDDDPWVRSKKKRKLPGMPNADHLKKKRRKDLTKSVDKEDDYCDHALAKLSQRRLSKIGGMAMSRPNVAKNYSSISEMSKEAPEQLIVMQSTLLRLMEELGEKLPPSMLDHLIDGLGGPSNVAEMTGRKGRIVQNEDGIQYESRCESDVSMENLNIMEKKRFMDGEKDIAIISEAASSGISLQADRRAVNQKRRVHITLELPWSADRAIQQFGRTHRSNQVSSPEYIFLITELAGERRFASTVAKRLESLGALTHGDRRATESRDLSRFNIDNRFGSQALQSVMKSILESTPMAPLPDAYTNEVKFFKDARHSLESVGLLTQAGPDRDYHNVNKFLNRLLGMEVDVQNALFEYFNNMLTNIIADAKRCNRWDMGILDFGSGEERVRKLETKVFIGKTSTGKARTELTTVEVERGMTWVKALEVWKKLKTIEEGFYISTETKYRKPTAVLVLANGHNKKKHAVYGMYKPNIGLQSRFEPLEKIRKCLRKALPDEVQPLWEDQYLQSGMRCIHSYMFGSCRRYADSLTICDHGLRTRRYHCLSGSVLSIWNILEAVLGSAGSSNMAKLQVIRLKIGDEKIVGSKIDGQYVAGLVTALTNQSTYTSTHVHAGQSLQLGHPLSFSTTGATDTSASRSIPAISDEQLHIIGHHPVIGGDFAQHQSTNTITLPVSSQPPAPVFLDMPSFD